MSLTPQLATVSKFLFKSRTGNFILSFLVFIFCLVLFELATRIFLYFYYPDSRASNIMKLSYQPYVLWVQDNKKEFYFNLQNKTYPPKEDKFRIVIVGGSTATQMPPKMLKESFQPLVDKEVEVWNLGNGGYILKQALLMLSLHGIPLKPDLIINLDGANDINNFTKQMTPGIPYHSKYVKMGVEEPIKKALFSLLNHSQFFLSLVKLRERSVETASQNRDEELHLMFHDFIDTINTFETLAKGSDAKYISVLQPYLFLRNSMTQREKGLVKRENYRKEFYKKSFLGLEALLLKKQLDPTTGFTMSALTAFDTSSEECFADSVHLTLAGKKILATYIAEQAKKKGLFSN